MKPIPLASVALALVLAIGCAPAATTGSGDPDFISTEQIREASATDAYHLIRSLRPAWLRARGGMTARTEPTDGGTALAQPEIVVYLDGNRLGGLEELDRISTAGLRSIRRLSGRDATQRFGTGHPHGAIVISRDP